MRIVCGWYEYRRSIICSSAQYECVRRVISLSSYFAETVF